MRALPSTAAGSSEPALVAMSCMAMHGAWGSSAPHCAGLSWVEAYRRRQCKCHHGCPSPGLWDAAGSSAGQTRRTRWGTHSAEPAQGRAALAPHAARVNRLARCRQQLLRHAEPPSCTGQPRWRRPSSPARDPAPSQTQTYKFSHSLPGSPRGRGRERERERGGECPVHTPRPAAHTARVPRPPQAQGAHPPPTQPHTG